MKTTVEISDPLLEQVKYLAVREKTSVRALIEEGLRLVISGREKAAGEFQLRDASFGGRGLQPHVADWSWDSLRDFAYEGRGA